MSFKQCDWLHRKLNYCVVYGFSRYPELCPPHTPNKFCLGELDYQKCPMYEVADNCEPMRRGQIGIYDEMLKPRIDKLRNVLYNN